MRKYLLISMLWCVHFLVQGQANDSVVLKFNEYLGYVKKYHPIARQAELALGFGQANLMKSRGGFDPKMEVDYATKQFKGTEYYEVLNATFKIPTWYGVELKGNFEQNDGDYLNPQNTVPEEGLYSAGISFSLGRGSWINERMATLKKAKLFREQSKADRDLLVNQVLFDASLAYFNWLQAYKDSKVFYDFLQNAQNRFKGIAKSASVGEIAAIDTVEAKIVVQSRALELEQAKVNLVAKTLELSNFIWLGDNIPVELQPTVIPEWDLDADIDITLEIAGKPLDSFAIENHPKLISLGYKIEALQVDKQLKTNKLLPTIDVAYQLLSPTPEYLNSFQSENYKGGFNFQFPLFLRKERGELKLAKMKLTDAKLEWDNAQVVVKNKILAIYNELESFETQNMLIKDMVLNYHKMLSAEERKFSFGESSLFLLNSRESKLIDAVLKQNAVQNKYYTAKAKLFNSLAVNPEGL